MIDKIHFWNLFTSKWIKMMDWVGRTYFFIYVYMCKYICQQIYVESTKRSLDQEVCCIYTHVYIYVNINVYVHVYIFWFLCICVHMYVNNCTCSQHNCHWTRSCVVFIHIYICQIHVELYMYISMYMYISICFQLFNMCIYTLSTNSCRARTKSSLDNETSYVYMHIHCNTLQETATRCNIMQYTATR